MKTLYHNQRREFCEIAQVIVSQWTWAATLLMSSNMGWRVGVSGPFWYASGATIQILLFAVLAIQVPGRR